MVEEFKKGQVVKAVWRAFTMRNEPAPPSFNAKIKKLAELGIPLSDDERVGQPGMNNSYTSFQAFELGVALKLVDAGYKQGEVAIYIKHVRQNLRRAHSEILENPPMIGANVLAKDRPDGPRRMVVHRGSTDLADPSRHFSADTSYWMTVRSLEFPQVLHPHTKKGELRFEPQFHRGLEALAHQMQLLAQNYTDDHRFVLELSNLAMIITNALTETLPTPRGRR
jgi:hypothetical protein